MTISELAAMANCTNKAAEKHYRLVTGDYTKHDRFNPLNVEKRYVDQIVASIHLDPNIKHTKRPVKEVNAEYMNSSWWNIDLVPDCLKDEANESKNDAKYFKHH